jgi:hypothetical protein
LIAEDHRFTALAASALKKRQRCRFNAMNFAAAAANRYAWSQRKM